MSFDPEEIKVYDPMKIEQIHADCGGCLRCALSGGRTNLVFGTGNPQAEVMLIGEGPGEQEDLQGIPFVGPAGKLLDTMLELIDLDREKVYIANMVKCRPPHNRDPRDEEIEACRPWLNAQITAVSPKIIVCLGRIAACSLIRKDFRITREHGQWFTACGSVCTAIYHPSALLRDPEKRPETFEDLRAIRAKIKELCVRTYDSVSTGHASL
jgi:DNA polymerase